MKPRDEVIKRKLFIPKALPVVRMLLRLIGRIYNVKIRELHELFVSELKRHGTQYPVAGRFFRRTLMAVNVNPCVSHRLSLSGSQIFIVADNKVMESYALFNGVNAPVDFLQARPYNLIKKRPKIVFLRLNLEYGL